MRKLKRIFKVFAVLLGISLFCLTLYTVEGLVGGGVPIPQEVVQEQEVIYENHDSHIKLWEYEGNRRILCMEDSSCLKLAEVGYYEARGESDEGVMLVMKTVLNRVEHRRWRNSIIGVVHEPNQFSYLWDGSLKRAKNSPKQWDRMYQIAHKMLNDDLTLPEEWGNITHYHSTKVKPFWSKNYKRVALVGNHVAYKCERDC